MEQVVLDASIIAKLFLKEEGSDTAIKLKDRHVRGEIEITAPSLLKYELINLLKNAHFSRDEICDALKAIRDYGFSVIELSDELFDSAAELSVNHSITSYDAAYVALAKDIDTLLYTADRKLLLKVKDLKFVKHLAEAGACAS